MLNIRADEACHRSVNHHFSEIPSFYDAHNDVINISQDGFKHVNEDELKEAELLLAKNKDI